MPKKKKKQNNKEEPELRIKLRSYDSKVMKKSCKEITKIADRAEVELVGPVPLPTEHHRYTVNRSTFAQNKSKEQFEVRVHKRLIEVENSNQRFLNLLKELTLPGGVEIEVKTI